MPCRTTPAPVNAAFNPSPCPAAQLADSPAAVVRAMRASSEAVSHLAALQAQQELAATSLEEQRAAAAEAGRALAARQAELADVEGKLAGSRAEAAKAAAQVGGGGQGGRACRPAAFGVESSSLPHPITASYLAAALAVWRVMEQQCVQVAGAGAAAHHSVARSHAGVQGSAAQAKAEAALAQAEAAVAQAAAAARQLTEADSALAGELHP